MFHRTKHALLCFILILGISAPLCFAAPRLKIEPPRKQIATDQTVTLKVHLEWPQEEGPYEITSLEPKLENLTLENQNQSQESGTSVRQILFYEFRPLKTGQAVIYPFEVSYRRSDSEPWTPILTSEYTIQVVPAVPIKPVLIGLGIAAGLFFITFAGIKITARLKAQAVIKNTPPPDPKQRVYARAEESIATFSSPDTKAKLTHWAAQLRTVVATYYDVPAKAVTSTEVLSTLKARDLPIGEVNEVVRLFDELNEFQFSQKDIPAYDLARMQKTLLQYIKGKIIIGNPHS
jgi:hypothetical protein